MYSFRTPDNVILYLLLKPLKLIPFQCLENQQDPPHLPVCTPPPPPPPPPLVFFVSALYSICWCQPQISVTVSALTSLSLSLSLLQWNCNEGRITHNLLYIIMHIIPQLEFLTFSTNLFYIYNFTRKRFALGGLSEPPRISLRTLPWVWHTYPQCFISTRGKIAIKNISMKNISIQTKLERAWR